MTDQPNTIDDITPDPEAPQWVAIIECQECYHRGTMYSTAEPRDTTAWDCRNCGAFDAIHETVVKSNTSELIEQ